MFCSVCGNELKAEAKFCPNCGQPTDDSNQNSESDKWFYINNSNIKDVVPSVPDNVVSSKYAWTLATVPILISWFAEMIGFNALIVLICTVSLNIIFLMLDKSELNKVGIDVNNWMWMGIVLVPAYLFVRASKTNKQYGYAIMWCVMFLFDLIVSNSL